MEKEYNDMVGKSLKTAFSRMGGDVAGPGGSMDYDQVEKSKSLNSLIKSVTEEDELDGGKA